MLNYTHNHVNGGYGENNYFLLVTDFSCHERYSNYLVKNKLKPAIHLFNIKILETWKLDSNLPLLGLYRHPGFFRLQGAHGTRPDFTVNTGRFAFFAVHSEQAFQGDIEQALIFP